MTVKRTILIVCLVLLVVIPLAGIIQAAQGNLPNQAPATQDPQNPTHAPESTPAQSGSRRQSAGQATAAPSTTISALGAVEANKVASLQFQTTGTISGVYATIGD
nr:hypothetical protein [Anaerolineae bacterium]